jgi:glutathione S-transferase
MASPIVYGPNFSTYVRATRLTLAEKPAPYQLVEVAMMQGAHKQDDFLKRNPFGKVPAFEHDDVRLYETSAIIRYIDRAFGGARLQPSDVKQLAKMDQAISIVDSFAYGCIIGKLVWQRIVTPMTGGTPDEGAIKDALPMIRTCLSEFERILGDTPWFGGAAISLGDLHLAPVFAYMVNTPESADLMKPHGRLRQWWERVSARDSMAKTQPKFG